MTKRSLVLSFFVLILSIVLFSCGDQNTSENVSGIKNSKEQQMNKESDFADDEIDTDVDMSEEITLTIFYGDEELIKDPVEEAFPNITIELIDIVQDIEDLEEQFAQGIVPDIIHGNDFPKFPMYEKAELVYDMTDLIEKFQFDLDRFDQNFLDIIRSYSPNNDELWGLPYIQGKAALHYNKNIFDLFGVDYPKDGMTMNEVLDLAEQVSGERNGVEYTGITLPSTDRYLYDPLQLNLVDPETDEPRFLEDENFQMIFETFQRIFHMQGEDKFRGEAAIIDRFVSQQTLAMAPIYFLGPEWTGLLEAQEQGLDWDIVTYPKWENQKDVAAFADGYWLGVSAVSEKKEQAFKVIEFLLSEEEIARKLRYPEESVYTDEAFFELTADDQHPLLADKNMEALYKYPAFKAPEGRSKYETIAKEVIEEQVDDFLIEGKDVITFLREVQEETRIRIQDAKSRE